MKNRDQGSLQLVPLCHQSGFSFLTAVASCPCLHPSVTDIARFSSFSGCNKSAEVITVGFHSNMFNGRSSLKSAYSLQANIKRISPSLSCRLFWRDVLTFEVLLSSAYKPTRQGGTKRDPLSITHSDM